MDNFDYSVIGQRIKTLRKRKGLNQTQLANLLGKSLRTVQKYETGEIEVSIDVVNEMAKHLDTTPTFILGYETNTAPIRSLADIMSFLFELNKVSSIKFDVDVKKPPRSNEWTCSIRFNGKEMDADHNADMCLFLEQWEEMREDMRSYNCSPGYTVFMVMYYTGLRVGELLALTPEDIDFDRHIISVNKNYQRLNGKDYIYPPKTEAGYREVVIPKVLENCLKDYLAKLYDVQPTDRIFPYDRGWVGRQMKYGCDHSGTQKIRVHDVRHTHASLLIDMGCTPLLVAERLGHERVQTTMDTYSHLYPNKQTEVAAQLDVLATKDDGYEKTS